MHPLTGIGRISRLERRPPQIVIIDLPEEVRVSLEVQNCDQNTAQLLAEDPGGR